MAERADWTIADSTAAPLAIRGRELGSLQERLSVEIEATGRRVTHIVIRERPELAVVQIYGAHHG